MTIKEHHISDIKIAEIESEVIIINSPSEALDLLGNIYYQGYSHLIFKEENITPSFFELSNGMAGEILQKFSNYRLGFAIVGDFLKYESKSVKDFIRESNKTGRVLFTSTIEEALDRIAK